MPARSRLPGHWRREPTQWLVLEDRDQGHGGRQARRQEGGHQGQHLRRRRADDERRLRSRRLRAGGRRHRRRPHPRRRRRNRRQDGVRVSLLLRRQPHQCNRPAGPQPVEARLHQRRLLIGLGRGGGGRRRGDGDRRRSGRLDPHPGVDVRDRRAQTHAWSRALFGRDADRADHRPHRPHDRYGRQQRAASGGHRRRRRARPAPACARSASPSIWWAVPSGPPSGSRARSIS